jgi:hypothetical protein
VSVDLNVYLARTSMPAAAQWARAITEANFPVQLDNDFDPLTATGFRPCLFRDVRSGFEIFSEPLTEESKQELNLNNNYDYEISLVTHSDLREFATSFVAACVLTRLTGGLFYDPQEDEKHGAEGIIEWARERLAFFETEIV